MASGFELISLTDTIVPLTDGAALESSDDGLDPCDFLSQSRTPDNSPPAIHINASHPAENDSVRSTPRFPSGSNTILSVEASVQDILGESVADTFIFLSVARDPQEPLVFLQAQQNSLGAQLSRHLRSHHAALAAGDDCGPVRAAIAHTLARLSETCVLLHEVYAREQAVAEALVADFAQWDRRRNRIIRHICDIKSDSSKYGTKLAGLLRRRHEVDAEVEAMERKIAALRAQRGAICKEIGETSSVLESRSTKYVHKFRDLEARGRSVLADYLLAQGVRPADFDLLVRAEPVDTTFTVASDAALASVAPTAPHMAITLLPPELSASSMGIQAFEVPTSDTVDLPTTLYAQGYANGLNHVNSIKRSFNALVGRESSIQKPPKAESKGIYGGASATGDISNTVTEKINLVPVLELLRHKIEAFEDMSRKTSLLSAFYDHQSVVCGDVCRLLETQERIIVLLLADENTTLSLLASQLQATIDILHKHLQSALGPAFMDAPKENYLCTMIQHEINALTLARNSLLHKVSDLVVDDEKSPPRLSREQLSMRITSAGFNPSFAPTLTSRVDTKVPESTFMSRKDTKGE